MNSYLLINPNDEEIDQITKNLKKDKGVVFEIKPQKTEYSIDEIRAIKKEVYVFFPYNRVYLLKNFENSSLAAQNAFLKLLEEPPANVYFLLTVTNLHKLLSTVVSRTKIINLFKKPQTTEKKEKINLDWPIFSDKREALQYLLKLLIFIKKDNCLIDQQKPYILKQIMKIKSLIEENNLNYQLATDYLLLLIKKNIKIKIDQI